MTVQTASSAPVVRLYGGWRRQRGIGMWGLDAVSTAVVLLCFLGPLLLAAASVRLGLMSAGPALLVAGLTTARVGGVPLGVVAQRRARWTWGTLRGHRSGRFGANAPDGGRAMPAPLDRVRVVPVGSGRGEPFALVHDPGAGTLTVALRCAASSTWLVDGADADGWVSAWHSWLAALGYLPAVRWVGVVVDTAPEAGTSLREGVLQRLDAGAPADVRALLRELVDRSPGAAAEVRTWVTVSFDEGLLGGAARRQVDEQQRGAEADRLMTGLESALGSCGVTVLGRAGVRDLVRAVRTAYDPVARGDLDRHRPDRGQPDLQWEEAAPVAVEDDWDSFRHDSGTSVSWGWQEAPRQQVTSQVLSRLLSPGRHAKRVALLYRPLPAADAARTLESEVNAAAFRDAYRRAQRRDETARDVTDREQARRAAHEEAMGAGVVLLSVYVTTTVTDPALLPEAVADVEARADQSKIRLRKLYGGQAAGFATTLPLGVHPARLARSRRNSR